MVVDWPELLPLLLRQRHILPNHLHFHGTQIFPQQCNVFVGNRRADHPLHLDLLPPRRCTRPCPPPPQRRRRQHPRNKRAGQSRRSRHFELHDPSPYRCPPATKNQREHYARVHVNTVAPLLG